MKLLNICQKTIGYSFYLLFFLVPLAFTSDTSELFEFNKLWVTFIITIVIGAAWFTKMVIKKEFRIQKTPLDILIGLFLVSEIISTFLSLDMHTSIWGYYSRFNGGLLSIFAYVFLYYAFVSNLKDDKEEDNKSASGGDIKRIYFFAGAIVLFFGGILISSFIKGSETAGIPFQLFAILITSLASFALFMRAAPTGIIKKSLFAIFSSAILVVLWGLPSHFGYDPTCLLFRGTFDVSCWTNDFQPKVRIFSTLGQPAWLAAYLVTLLPVLTGLFINFIKGKNLKKVKSLNFLFSAGFVVLFTGFYLSLLYTQARSAILAFWLILPVLLALYFWYFVKPVFDKKSLNLDFKVLVFILLLTAGVTFFAGQPFGALNKFTLSGVKNLFSKPVQTKEIAKPAQTTPAFTTELGGTDSGKIRLLVWQGAIDIWRNNPIFGSGLETYAFAYYQYRPAAHNLVSEWKYLYNKAHNEYLNYLATTGTVGIITYVSMIGGFLFISLKTLHKKRKKLSQTDFLVISIIAGYSGILITNFFGFSVVIINIFFYLIPAFVFILLGLVDYEKAYTVSFSKKESFVLGGVQKISVGVIALLALYLLFTLTNYWNADRKYYFGSNYNRAGDYQKAYTFLKEAVDMRPGEPVFRDEFAYSNAVLGSAILAQSGQQKDSQEQNIQIAKQLIDAAIKGTNEVTAKHPNNIVFLKTKVRVYYTLGQVDQTYLPQALEAIKKTQELAPTDADVSYNLGVLYGQTGDYQNAIKTLENTIRLKPNYPGGNAHYALGIFYRQAAVDAKGNVVNQEYNKKAIDTMKLIIKNFGPNQQAEDAIKAWNGGKQ